MKFYLIQTADWAFNINEPNFKPTNLFFDKERTSRIFTFNYMGSAEFEFGAVPKALLAIAKEKDEYQLVKTDLHNHCDTPFYLYCKKDKLNETLDALKSYLENPYHLKEYSGLTDAFRTKEQINKFRDADGSLAPCFQLGSQHFWFDIQNLWMGFFGATREVNWFNELINPTLDFVVEANK